jgi:hypothetical protein
VAMTIRASTISDARLRRLIESSCKYHFTPGRPVGRSCAPDAGMNSQHGW